MNKTTQEAARCFMNNINKKNIGSNTTVEDGCMFLFGNLIAKKLNGGRIAFTLAGWNTVTTRERLSGLGIKVRSKRGEPFLICDVPGVGEIARHINESEWYIKVGDMVLDKYFNPINVRALV